ncbi:MAG TPA: sugar phosphate isomerase/epimerase family protein [Chryseolinea sp.]
MKLTLFSLFLFSLLSVSGQHKLTKPEIGIVGDFEQDSLLHANGYKYLVESIVKCFSPVKISDEQFDERLKQFRNLHVTVFAMNIFMPGDMKLVGPDVKEEAILNYAKAVFERCQRAGISMVVWGSGGARRVPDGYDHNKAKEQFIYIARKVAVLAKKYKIDLALENLNSTETNFINTVEDAFDVVNKVDQKNFWLCIDIYHMLMEGEGPAVIEKTKKKLIHCDIAEKLNRAPPGVRGDDFRPYLSMLKKIGYSGKIVLECRWTDLPAQLASARLNLQKQIDEVWQ